MKDKIPWRAWYADGSVYDSEGTTYEDLPRDGMVGVVEYEGGPYRQQTAVGDWYWMSGGRWQRKKTGEWGTWKPEPGCCADPIRSTTRLPEEEYEAIRHDMRTRPWR